MVKIVEVECAYAYAAVCLNVLSVFSSTPRNAVRPKCLASSKYFKPRKRRMSVPNTNSDDDDTDCFQEEDIDPEKSSDDGISELKKRI